MARYSVYLEVAESGMCMAHVLDLPGCFARSSTRGWALDGLQRAIRDHWSWLRRHGESAPDPDDPIILQVAAEFEGSGPFDPGDRAALFPPEREPIGAEEVDRYLRLMANARSDLLALVQGLTDELLDWRLYPESYTLRRVLRHIGNAEQWYVSRIASPETLPPEWQDDDEMELYDFLEMSRRTAVRRLRALSDEERSGVFHPKRWTSSPGEPWTARKVLRRFLEHEREHTEQVREILELRRHYLIARLAAERAGLWDQVLDLDEPALTQVSVLGGWTVQDILAHIAAWDRWEARTMQAIVAGVDPDFKAVQDLDAANAAFVAEWRDRTLAEVVAESKAARAEWVAWLSSLPLEELFKPRAYAGYDWTLATVPLKVQWDHDAEHAQQIAAWRTDSGIHKATSPMVVIKAARQAMRRELRSAVVLIPPDERESRPVCGTWSLKDVLGHVADWARFCAESVVKWASGDDPGLEQIGDFDTWNEAWVAARRDQPWQVACEDLDAAHQEMGAMLESLTEAELDRNFPLPWNPQTTAYDWVAVFVRHDRDHASDLWKEPE